jgi:predicted dehydrogenase
LLEYGVKKILLEKPGVGNIEEIYLLKEKSDFYNAEVLIAYNRRFYTSVIESEKIIIEDGGATSFHFEFTEWSHQIKNLPKHRTELQNWFLANSTHVIDTAFFICGRPKEIACFHNGSSNWHPKSINFVGAGVSEKNEALFSYEANWEAPGRWNLDIMTKDHRLIFKPMEKLQIQNIGSVNVSLIEDIDYSLDEKYKPGLYLQTKAFIENDFSRFCSVNEQFLNLKTYKKISGY